MRYHSFCCRRTSRLPVLVGASETSSGRTPRTRLLGFDIAIRQSSFASLVTSTKARVFGCTASIYLSRSEEHTSELQSRFDIVCRLLLEKKTQTNNAPWSRY